MKKLPLHPYRVRELERVVRGEVRLAEDALTAAPALPDGRNPRVVAVKVRQLLATSKTGYEQGGERGFIERVVVEVNSKFIISKNS